MTVWIDDRKRAAQRKRHIPKMPEGYYSKQFHCPRCFEIEDLTKGLLLDIIYSSFKEYSTHVQEQQAVHL